MIVNITNNGAHNGEVTAHHDHFATGPISANFKTKKTIKTIVPKPIPVV